MRQILALATFLLLIASAHAQIAREQDWPFEVYAQKNGLSQPLVMAIEQDDAGFLWLATFGGLNRFDGKNVRTLTTRHGLRDNFINSLTFDDSNRLWVGDASGGLTMIRNGRVEARFDPDPDSESPVRSITVIGDQVFISTEWHGVRLLDLGDEQRRIQGIEGSPPKVSTLATEGDDVLWFTDYDNQLWQYHLSDKRFIKTAETDIAFLSGSPETGIYFGDGQGRVGRLIADQIEWGESLSTESIYSLAFDGTTLTWINTETELINATDPRVRYESFSTQGASFVDRDGVLWIGTSTGLTRFLGQRFNIYSLGTDRRREKVFALQPDASGNFWMGTENGLAYVDSSGDLVEFSKLNGLPQEEIRAIKFSADGQSMWFSHIYDRVHRMDMQTKRAEPVFPAQPDVFLDLVIDSSGAIWASTYSGILYRYDPQSGVTTEQSFGTGNAIYSLALDNDQMLWFTVNDTGLYRMDTTQPDSAAEQIVGIDQLGDSKFLTQVNLINEPNSPQEIWFSGSNGGLFRWREGRLEHVITESKLTDETIDIVQPLPDQQVVFSSERGVYHLDLKSAQLEHYGALSGFTPVSTSVHASYYEGGNALWIGHPNGLAMMDLSVPATRAKPPQPTINSLESDEQSWTTATDVRRTLSANDLKVEFSAISTPHPDDIEYSYRLLGAGDEWSDVTTNRSIKFSSLAPGTFEFQVRARGSFGGWSEPAVWSFTVPTPWWRSAWFIVLAVVMSASLLWFGVQLRLQTVARTNKRLKDEVAARTRSIQAANQELAESYEQLKVETESRLKSEAIRADVEARFHRAYENAPIGMALVRLDGAAYSANPKLKEQFWPGSSPDDAEPLVDILAPEQRDTFRQFWSEFCTSDQITTHHQFQCIDAYGDDCRVDFQLSKVNNSDGALAYVVLMAHDVTESHAMTERLEFQANFDELTGLTNRRAFSNHLESIAQTDHDPDQIFLVFIDLDRFKVVNDSAGHQAGDELLKIVATTLTKCTRPTDVVARLGGDEFSLILMDCPEREAMAVSERIRNSIHELEFLWEGNAYRIGASIGVVPLAHSPANLEELQKVADAACYAAKSAGRNRVHLVAGSEDLALEHRGDMRWAQRLSEAIDNDRFELFGQQLHSAKDDDSEVVRIEVLLRMRDRKTNKLIPPSAFIPVAERYGLQTALDQWVVGRVLRLFGDDILPCATQQQYWVNLSAASICDPAFAKWVVTQITDSKLPAGAMNFEITETTAIRSVDVAASLISELRALGCELSLDDFGTALSSFNNLKRLNVDYLKIDGRLVRDVLTDQADQIFVQSIIDIAHTLGVRTVAKMVEDPQTLALIKDMGVDFVQGFVVHRPEILLAGELTETVKVASNQ
ncbi:MAG: EAL domain-containing protein [Pseudomonadota bacterium]